MISRSETDRSDEVLVWAPRGRDGELTVQLLERHGLTAATVGSCAELVARVLDAGCAVIAAEALDRPARERLVAALAAQPPWSDFPIVLLAPRGYDRSDQALRTVTALGNVSILERPVHGGALVAALMAALRGRRRQYEALEAIRRRDQFLAMLGHELRNPLAAVTLALETIPADESVPFARQRAIIERQARHLSRLVEDLLDVARVTSGKVRLQLTVLDINEVAQRCVHGAELAARSRGVDLCADLSPQPLLIDGDLVRLEEVFNNLIDNALKYSPEGAAVTVRTRREGSRCVVEVADTGIGIASDMLDRVFDLFAQAERELDRSSGGLGIGLTLVRSLIQLHGGAVAIHSAGLGHGTTFVVELPLATTAAEVTPQPEVASPERTRQQRVLLVEDNIDLLEMTRTVLEASNCVVTTAGDGAEGLARLVADGPDVAFVDLGIPHVDGYAVARRAREQGVTTVLIAVTGYGQPDDRRRSYEAGFDLHLTKPVTGAALREALVAASRGRLGAHSADDERVAGRPASPESRGSR